MRKLKRIAAVVLTGVLACSLLALSGCGEDSEEVIRAGVTEELDGLKALDEATLDELMGGADASALSEFTTYGIDAREFVKTYLDGFDYTIEGIEIDEDRAYVDVTFTCKSFTDIMDVLENSIVASASDLSVQGMTTDELNAKVGELLMDATTQTQVRTTEPFTLEYQKADNVWEPAANMESTITAALFN